MELKELEKIMKVIKNTDLTEFDYEKDELKLYIKKSNLVLPKKEKAVKIESPKKEIVDIKSFNVGKFFYSTKGNAAKVAIGNTIENGDLIGYIESMGIKTEIFSTVKGKIVEILVENGKIADYGRVILRIEKD